MSLSLSLSLSISGSIFILMIIIILLYKNGIPITSVDKDLPRYVTKKWIQVRSIRKNYSVNKEIRIKTPMLRSDLCDFSDAYIVVKRVITVTSPNNVKEINQ